MADWSLALVERMDGRYSFTLTDLVNAIDHESQRSYRNRQEAIYAAEGMRDDLIGAEVRSNTVYDFDPLP